MKYLLRVFDFAVVAKVTLVEPVADGRTRTVLGLLFQALEEMLESELSNGINVVEEAKLDQLGVDGKKALGIVAFERFPITPADVKRQDGLGVSCSV